MPPMPIRRIHPTACGRHRVRPTVSPRKFACQTFSLSEDMSPTPEVCPEERAIYVTGGQTKHGFNFRFMPEQMARVRAFHDTGTPMRCVLLVTRMSSLYGNRCICAVSATKQRSEVRLRRCRRNRITRANITPRWCRSVADRFAVLCLHAVKCHGAFPHAARESKPVGAHRKSEFGNRLPKSWPSRVVRREYLWQLALPRGRDTLRTMCAMCRTRPSLQVYLPSWLRRSRGFE